jgi:hypothetical protein
MARRVGGAALRLTKGPEPVSVVKSPVGRDFGRDAARSRQVPGIGPPSRSTEPRAERRPSARWCPAQPCSAQVHGIASAG